LVNQHGGKIVNRLIIAGIGVLAVALLAMGCGGGGGDEATAQVSKAQFYKQARAICANVQKKLRVEVEASPSGDISVVYSKAAPLLKQEAEELEAISGPEQVEEEVKPLIAHVSKASHLIAREGEAAAKAPSTQAYKKEAAELHLSEC
jgi:hypothetical protein